MDALYLLSYEGSWLRGKDLNLRPPGYEPDELPAAPPRGIIYFSGFYGGGGRIRTFEAITQQIYSLPPLATWVPLRQSQNKLYYSFIPLSTPILHHVPGGFWL